VWNEQVQRFRALVKAEKVELVLSALNRFRLKFEQDEVAALRRCAIQADTILRQWDTDNPKEALGVHRSREQWARLGRLEDYTERMLPLEVHEINRFCVTSWSHHTFIVTWYGPLEVKKCMKCARSVTKVWKCESCEVVFCVICADRIVLLRRYYMWLRGNADDLGFGLEFLNEAQMLRANWHKV
jgi:hypothetical protein